MNSEFWNLLSHFAINGKEKIKQTSNRRKYCSSCWKDVERKIKRETWHKYKDKYTRSLENPANLHK